MEEFATKLEDQMIQDMELNRLLVQEQTIRLRLRKQLEETKEQLAHQKYLKEMFIKKEKEARNELERLKRLSDKETIDAVRIAAEIGNNIKKKKKKVLQKEFEELKVAHVTSREKFSAELRAEREKNKALQQELKQLKVLYQTSPKYETELKAEREKTDILQRDVQSQAKRMLKDPELIKQPRAERDTWLGRMEEEIQIQTEVEGQGGQPGKKPPRYSQCRAARRNSGEKLQNKTK
eukprot:superscaffoldBa00004363_g18758